MLSLTLLSEIFKPNISTKAKGKGTGIGLYISQQIAEKFNSILTVENTSDGAKFIFIQN